MNEEPPNEKPASTYTPSPDVPPELAARLTTILAVLSGKNDDSSSGL